MVQGGNDRTDWNNWNGRCFNGRRLVLVLVVLVTILVDSSAAQDGDILLELRRSLSDPLGRLNTWSTSTGSHCRWTGITCRNGTDQVVSINLSRQSLQGTISPTIGSLTGLVSLDLSRNNISGPIPSTISNCTHLEDINLSDNTLTGSIPVNLSQLSRLVNLRLHSNLLQGSIPPSLGSLTRLERLRLEDNLLEGAIPGELGACTLLNFLHVFDNRLHGSIPRELGRLRRLTHLSLHNNNLSGELPRELGGCVSLRRFSIYGNDFQGSSIPGEFGGLVNVNEFQASNCNLSGSLPPELGNMTGLDTFDVSNNRLTGELPAGLGSRWSEVVTLNLSRNLFTGLVPESISGIVSLVTLDLSRNAFTGELPASLELLRSLKTVLISGNSFQGRLPPALGIMSSLETLDASRNRLSGGLPQGLCSRLNLTYVDLSNNELDGTLEALENCSSLRTLVVSGNRLNGSFPRLTSTSLASLDLSSNRLGGELPEQVGVLTELRSLRLANNRFTGPLPHGIGRLPLLENLDLSANSFDRTLPDISSLTLLRTLDLSNNFLTGDLPASSMGEFLELEMLNVSNNRFTGPIPSLSSLAQLKEFNFSNNQFTGEIPQIRAFTTGPASAFMNNLQLCGPPLGPCNQSPGTPTPPGDRRRRKRNTSAGRVAGLVFIVLGGVFLAGSVCFLVYSRRALRHRRKPSVSPENKFADRVPLLFAEIEKATEGFSEANVIGTGPHGVVYKGIFAWEKILAVKVVREEQEEEEQGTVEDRKNTYYFTAAARKLNRIRHPNIVKLEEFLIYRGAKVFLYEYMPNRSLGEALHRTAGPKLHWNTRYKIAIGAAQGLSYLHHQHSIVHCDIKSNNLLLDSAFGARIADLGLAKLIKSSRNLASLNRSLGYTAPETPKASQKGDVYSFGIVLLELLTGRYPVMEDGTSLAQWVRSCISDDQPLSDIVDPILRNVNGPFQEEISTVFKVALICTDQTPTRRPSMKEVVEVLTRIRREPGGPKLRSLRSFIHRRSFVLLSTQEEEV